MYSSPSFQLASPSKKKSHHSLFLLTETTELDQHDTKSIPQHLEEHASLKGERGAKLAIHTETANLYFGLGKSKLFTPQEASEWGEACANWVAAEGITEILVHIPEELEHPAQAIGFLKGMGLAGLRCDELKTKAAKKPTHLKKILVTTDSRAAPSADDLDQLQALVEAVAFARVLGELPPLVANPQGIVDRFSEEAKEALGKNQIDIEVWDEKKIAKEKMGLFMAVAQGSHEDSPPRFLIARHGEKYKKKGPTLFLVGKGITFDTGGVNLKTSGWMDLLGMRKDMCGCAAVLGAILAIARMKLPIHVVAVTPMTVNAIGSKAVLPGDIVKSYAGKTVEIMNTDAEGRLVLADALHYAVKEKADYIVDVATLTGACAIALGQHHSGLFSNDEDFGRRVLAASTIAGEPAWPLPLSPRYGEELKSQLADIANMGKTREGGASLGAKFLENFVNETPWVHLDIAGTHDLGGPLGSLGQVRAAGRMVHTLTELAKSLAEESR